MFNRPIEMFVFDVFVAILKIEDTSKRYSNAEELLYNYNDWDSVIREFEIIGEASKHLVKNEALDKKYQKIVDFRNKISHEYFGVESSEIWNIIYSHLPELKILIEHMIVSIEIDLKKELISSFIEDNTYLDFVVEQLKLMEVLDEK